MSSSDLAPVAVDAAAALLTQGICQGSQACATAFSQLLLFIAMYV